MESVSGKSVKSLEEMIGKVKDENERANLILRALITKNIDVPQHYVEELIGFKLRNEGYRKAINTTRKVPDKVVALKQQARIYNVWAQDDPKKLRDLGHTYMQLYISTQDMKYLFLGRNYLEVSASAPQIKERQRLKNKTVRNA